MQRRQKKQVSSFTRVRAAYRAFASTPHAQMGKMTLVAVLGSAVAFSFVLALFDIHTPTAIAQTSVPTTVTVRNIAPAWTIDARESVATVSATTTPTNVGSDVSWTVTATDNNGDDYYLIICSTDSATAHNGAAPTCGGTQWAISPQTVSTQQATATATALGPWAEKNDWWAFICDDNPGSARCNAASSQGATPGNPEASPFVVNHPPVFTSIGNLGARNPGQTQTWTADAYDYDTLRADTMSLVICKAQGFNGTCTGGLGMWASSTLVTTDPATTTTISIPTPDGVTAGWVYIIDNFNLQATSSPHDTNSSFTVNNVAPVITEVNASSTISLTVESGASGPFYIDFLVSDDNGCQNGEVASAVIDFYRSGATCNGPADYNANSCYAGGSSNFPITCTQAGTNSCSGSSDTGATWTCSYNMWYVAEPTDVGSRYPNVGEDWVAAARATDDDGLTSATSTAASQSEVASFPAISISKAYIDYEALEPGQNMANLSTTTDLIATGNTGVDESLEGDTMCIGWTAYESCDAGGVDPTQEIAVGNQQFATSSVSYSGTGAYTLTSSASPSTLLINVPKTTATSSPQSRDTYWGIAIPGTITYAGDYIGQNVITAVRSAASAW